MQLPKRVMDRTQMEKDAGQALQHKVRSNRPSESITSPNPTSIEATLNTNGTLLSSSMIQTVYAPTNAIILVIHINHVTKRADKVYNALPILQPSEVLRNKTYLFTSP